MHAVCTDFVTIAPDDVRDMHAIRDSRPFRQMFRFPHVRDVTDLKQPITMLRRGTDEYSQRSLWRAVVENPIAATVHFHNKTMVANRILFGIDPTRKQTGPFQARPKGVLGRIRSYVRAVLALTCIISEPCVCATQGCVCEGVQRAGVTAHTRADVWIYNSCLRIEGGVSTMSAKTGASSTRYAGKHVTCRRVLGMTAKLPHPRVCVSEREREREGGGRGERE
jgi:hypothetical protein